MGNTYISWVLWTIKDKSVFYAQSTTVVISRRTICVCVRVHVYICIQHVCVCVCVFHHIIYRAISYIRKSLFYAQLTNVVICQGDLDRGASNTRKRLSGDNPGPNPCSFVLFSIILLYFIIIIIIIIIIINLFCLQPTKGRHG